MERMFKFLVLETSEQHTPPESVFMLLMLHLYVPSISPFFFPASDGLGHIMTIEFSNIHLFI